MRAVVRAGERCVVEDYCAPFLGVGLNVYGKHRFHRVVSQLNSGWSDGWKFQLFSTLCGLDELGLFMIKVF